jgi:hypothetical protein
MVHWSGSMMVFVLEMMMVDVSEIQLVKVKEDE